MPCKDPEKRRAYSREYNKRQYALNPEVHRQRVQDRKDRIKAEYAAYKATLRCLQCGENHIGCLEFHHPDPSVKEGNPSSLICQSGRTFERVKKELEKCIVLCANCHRKLHWQDRTSEVA